MRVAQELQFQRTRSCCNTTSTPVALILLMWSFHRLQAVDAALHRLHAVDAALHGFLAADAALHGFQADDDAASPMYVTSLPFRGWSGRSLSSLPAGPLFSWT